MAVKNMRKKITVKLRQLGRSPGLTTYKIESFTNTVDIDINGKYFRIGDVLSESQASVVCKWSGWTVTIN